MDLALKAHFDSLKVNEIVVGEMVVFHDVGPALYEVEHLFGECWEVVLKSKRTLLAEGEIFIKIQDEPNLSFKDGSRPNTTLSLSKYVIIFHPRRGYFAVGNINIKPMID